MYYKKSSSKVVFGLVVIISFLFSLMYMSGLFADSTTEEDKTVKVPMETIPFTASYYKETLVDLTEDNYREADKMHNRLVNSKNKEEVFEGEYNELMNSYIVMSYKYIDSYKGEESMGTQSSWKSEDGLDMCQLVIYPEVYRNGLKQQEKIEEKCLSIIYECGIDKNTTIHDAIMLFDDWLCKHVEYDYSLKSTSISDCLFKGKAICHSYSNTLAKLCSMVGIKACCLVSESLNHEWNEIWINDNAYEIDVTWDDSGDSSSGMYFMLKRLEMENGHNGHKWVRKTTNMDTNGFWDLRDNLYYLSDLEGKRVDIEFDSNGGRHNNPSVYKYGENRELEDAKKFGYKFIGWYTDGNRIIRNTRGLGYKPCKLTAKYTPINREKLVKVKSLNIRVRLKEGSLIINKYGVRKNFKVVLEYRKGNKRVCKTINTSCNVKLLGCDGYKLKVYRVKRCKVGGGYSLRNVCVKTINIESLLRE